MDLDLEHAAHAIATFSEIGMGLAVATIADLPRWRYRVASDGALKRESLLTAANEAGWVYFIVVSLVIKLRAVIWYAAPLLALILGYIALQALAHSNAGWLAHIPWFSSITQIAFIFSLFSFWLAILISVMMATAARTADRSTSAETSPLDLTPSS